MTVEDIPAEKDDKNTSDALLSLMTSIEKGNTGRLHWLAIVPPQFQVFKPTERQPTMPQLKSHNSDMC